MTRHCPLLFLSLALLLSLGWTWAQADLDQSKPGPDSDLDLDQDPDQRQQQDLVEALQLLMGQIHNPDKRGSIPTCGMGDRCAMKFGPRIGKLCDCGRRANCNSYLLKCI